MELEPIKLTKKLLTKIKPEDIIFGEFAGFGAMGAAGTARFFTLDGDTRVEGLVIGFFGKNR